MEEGSILNSNNRGRMVEIQDIKELCTFMTKQKKRSASTAMLPLRWFSMFTDRTKRS